MANRILVDEDTGERFEPIYTNQKFLGGKALVLRKIDPEPKVIDWSAVSAEANIPAKFGAQADNVETLGFYGAPTTSVIDGTQVHQEKCTGMGWQFRTLVTGIPVPWFGGDCPLPEGVVVKVWLRGDKGPSPTQFEAVDLRWEQGEGWSGPEDIIAFEVTGTADNYVFNKEG